jgi:hypothetical protein
VTTKTSHRRWDSSGDGASSLKLTLTDVRQLGNGSVILTYIPR